MPKKFVTFDSLRQPHPFTSRSTTTKNLKWNDVQKNYRSRSGILGGAGGGGTVSPP